MQCPNHNVLTFERWNRH